MQYNTKYMLSYSLGDATIMLIGVVSFLRDYRTQAAVIYHFPLQFCVVPSCACAPSPKLSQKAVQ